MYRYETHLHTLPVSKCAKVDVRTALQGYKDLGYDGVFITNHFIDGNVGCDRSLPYAEQIEFYFSDYETGLALSEEIGIKVFCGVEMSYHGNDFLVYGLDKEWYLAHPEIMQMKREDELAYLQNAGALVIHAHPFREEKYIRYIRLFPRQVHGVEIINAGRPDDVNEMAKLYADHYGLVYTAGSDNHKGPNCRKYAGMESETPLTDEKDFIRRVLAREMSLFHFTLPEEE